MSTWKQNGTLLVRSVTANGALPVEGTRITVRGTMEENEDYHATFVTDQSGKTEKISLPAPEKSLSQNPGNKHPYGTYDITAEKEGYYIHQALEVPVFAGVTSVQTLEMIPRSYGGVVSLPGDTLVTDENGAFGVEAT